MLSHTRYWMYLRRRHRNPLSQDSNIHILNSKPTISFKWEALLSSHGSCSWNLNLEVDAFAVATQWQGWSVCRQSQFLLHGHRAQIPVPDGRGCPVLCTVAKLGFQYRRLIAESFILLPINACTSNASLHTQAAWSQAQALARAWPDELLPLSQASNYESSTHPSSSNRRNS